MKRTDNYLDTVDLNSPEAYTLIDQYRRAVRLSNRLFKSKGDPTRHFLRVRGRLGKDNPHAHLYRQGGPLHRSSAQDIKLEHSTRADLYVGRRSTYRWTR